jgi:hypothetical protein
MASKVEIPFLIPADNPQIHHPSFLRTSYRKGSLARIHHSNKIKSGFL